MRRFILILPFHVRKRTLWHSFLHLNNTVQYMFDFCLWPNIMFLFRSIQRKSLRSRQDLLLPFVINDSKWRVFGFLTSGWTKRSHLKMSLWEIVMIIVFNRSDKVSDFKTSFWTLLMAYILNQLNWKWNALVLRGGLFDLKNVKKTSRL